MRSKTSQKDVKKEERVVRKTMRKREREVKKQKQERGDEYGATLPSLHSSE